MGWIIYKVKNIYLADLYMLELSCQHVILQDTCKLLQFVPHFSTHLIFHFCALSALGELGTLLVAYCVLLICFTFSYSSIKKPRFNPDQQSRC